MILILGLRLQSTQCGYVLIVLLLGGDLMMPANISNKQLDV